MAKVLFQSKYSKLIEDVGVICEGVRKTTVNAYWQIGKRIFEVEQDGVVKAQYGTLLIKSLASDLTKKYGPGFSRESLIRMRLFYKKYSIGSAPTLLNWTQYNEILGIKDDRTRFLLEKKAVKENLSSRQLRQIVRQEASVTKIKRDVNVELLERPRGLILNNYKLADDPQNDISVGHICLDCGFYVDVCVPAKLKPQLTEKPSFTYSARVKRVVDGDTLLVEIDLGFNARTRARLRLHGIDTPELGSQEGIVAKRYVVRLLPKGKQIVIRTYSTDVFGRFVADVFYLKSGHELQVHVPKNEASEIIENGVFLNNQLLEKGFARRI